MTPDPRTAVRTFEVDDVKLSDYLLNLDHDDGGPKAARFLRHNFDADLLREALIEQGRVGVVEKPRATPPWGYRFDVVEPIMTPLNTYLPVRTVWEVKPDLDPTVARLITVVFED